MTLVCVPILVESIDAALADAAEAKDCGADIAELRIDPFFTGSTGSETEDSYLVAQLQHLLAECPLPVLLTCRHADEGGHYDGDETDRVSLLEKLTAGSDHPPAYLDFELAAYLRSANIRQKINLCVDHPKQTRPIPTRLVLSTHDFGGFPPDLHRRLLAAYSEPACAVVKIACRARSLRDTIDLFELVRTAPKPTIALGMGDFGLLSRVLAPKVGGFLTFAALRDEAATAPGQPTLEDLLGLYRFRSIGRGTAVYGVVGWPVAHSLSPLVHNAAFERLDHDGVYLPLPVAADPDDRDASAVSFAATIGALFAEASLGLRGVSVTIPHKESAAVVSALGGVPVTPDGAVRRIGAANTLVLTEQPGGVRGLRTLNTDADAIGSLLAERLGGLDGRRVVVVGAGGAARAAADAVLSRGGSVLIAGRTHERAVAVADALRSAAGMEIEPGRSEAGERLAAVPLERLPEHPADAYVHCTPVGMAGGPDPDGLGIAESVIAASPAHAVFLETVYIPLRTPLLRAAREAGRATIDGVEMFVRQAAAQCGLWTGSPAPIDLFDRLVRARLAQPMDADRRHN